MARHRVLLVEDHADFAEATAALMRHHGLDVSIATSGGDALKLAEECNPVLVLCDLALPDMTGLDVVQALRARRGANDCLAVILSAMSANDLREIEGHTKPATSRCCFPSRSRAQFSSTSLPDSRRCGPRWARREIARRLTPCAARHRSVLANRLPQIAGAAFLGKAGRCG